jgi:hypothetical protein
MYIRHDIDTTFCIHHIMYRDHDKTTHEIFMGGLF